MKITKKVLATITSAALFFSLCMPITSMAEETPTLTYTFTEGTSAGIADGTITLSGLEIILLPD